MRTNIIRFLQFTGVAALAAPLLAQTDPLAAFDVRTNIGTPGYAIVLTDVAATFQQGFIDYVRAKQSYDGTFRTLLRDVEQTRVDEQAGASATAGGTASAAEKAGITGLITAALETGALTQTLDQNLLTLRANGEGLFRFLSGQEVLPACLYPTDTSCDPSPLNNLELTVSFDISKSNTQAVTGQNPVTGATLAALLTSDKRQFSSASARFAIINSRDLRSPKYRTAWNAWYLQNRDALRRASGDLLANAAAIFDRIERVNADGATVPFDDPASVYVVWRQAAQAAVMAAPPTVEGVSTALAHQLDLLEARMRESIPDFDNKVVAATNAAGRYYANTRAGFDLGNQPMLTLQVTYQEPTLQPKMVNSKLVFAWSPKKKGPINPGTLTLNAGITNYTKAQPKDAKGNTGYWRDAQVAVQFDRPIDKSGLSTFSIGAYFQYQIAPGLINIPAGAVAPGTNIPLPADARQLLAGKGTLAVAQASLTLQLPNSGIRVPIGISWSNRTELLSANEVRGHVGFSFDTHSLLLFGRQGAP